MRPPRIVILVLFFSACLFLFARSIAALHRSISHVATANTDPPSPFPSFFSLTAPFSLFPPNAVISLTDDNSTFFPARPAAFGPAFPSKGLSGPVWIGSGFADDNLPDGEGEGELGCSDVAGWEDGQPNAAALKTAHKTSATDESATVAGSAKNSKRDGSGPPVDRTFGSGKLAQDMPPSVDDGTDDYLHHGLQGKNMHHDTSAGSASSHADIQVIQETAEITGKVVLLSRGGCGFLEKVKWAQRRGAAALIVGDNQKGAPLIHMFARGNVDNVTIPSAFTSRTTAHLLSSLMQTGGFMEDIVDGKDNAALKIGQDERKSQNKRNKAETASTAVITGASTSPNAATELGLSSKEVKHKASHVPVASANDSHGNWITRFFHWGGVKKVMPDRSRPPSSGRLNWIIVDEWSDEKDEQLQKNLDKATMKSVANPEIQPEHRDNFQIGIEDWRDPDLLYDKTGNAAISTEDFTKSTNQKAPTESKDASKHAGKKGESASSKRNQASKANSITPGSGQYIQEFASSGKSKKTSLPALDDKKDPSGLLSKIFGEDDDAGFTPNEVPPTAQNQRPIVPPQPSANDQSRHEGLWVTITPTGSASPFFDTLLVLVVSPLITLTVVYALLILRAKIRRRRWRAPKSVVERLPIRTYHTVVASGTQTPRLPSPTSASPTTPLLQGRPRSRTTTDVVDSADSSAEGATQNSRSSSRVHEKTSEWKKYMGRQVECVVCLEEYVDGISRVMSLPCGHEFHAECM